MSESLNMLADKINECFITIDRSVAAASHMRIEVGKMLIEAQRRVRDGECGNIKWQAWSLAHIRRSDGDIRKCMRLAKAADPAAALEKERKKRAEGMARRKKAVPIGTGNSAASPAKPKLTLAALAQNRPVLTALSREESGVPSDEEAMEQDPHSPPGVTRHLAHISQYGMVQVQSPAEIEARDVQSKFDTLTLALLKRIAKEEWPTLDDLYKLDDKQRLVIEARLNKYLPAAEAVLTRLRVKRRPEISLVNSD